jgi:hypothetical protein
MKKLSKEFWRGLWVTALVMGCIYGCTAYYAPQERKQKEEFRRRDNERREAILRGLDSIRLHNDSIRKSVSTKKGKRGITIGADDDDRDPYDDPDFDDLIPGEEYDEEFVDRSQGDPELYNYHARL